MRLSTTRVVSRWIRVAVLFGGAICVALPAVAGQVTDVDVRAYSARQVGSQVDRLIAVIKDEYAAEPPNGRRVQFIDLPQHGTIAVATFVIEGFADGNNVHQYLAVFGPPNDRGPDSPLPYYSLSALTEVGDGCAVDVLNVRVSGIREDGSLTLTLPTFLTSTTDSCEGKTRRSYVLRTNDARLGQLELR